MPDAKPDPLAAFEALARGRRAVRHFSAQPLPDGVLQRLLDCARWAPSGYNLQPTQLVVVDEAALKPGLRAACLGQAQVEEAPATVVFVGDSDVVARNFERVLEAERAIGAMNDGYEAFLRRLIPLAFGRGPAGLGGLAKGVYSRAARPFKPVPDVPAADLRQWLTKQVMLAAMNFMLAASAAGLGTVPMEGFDESRVKALLGIPGRHVVPVVIPVGVPADGDLRKSRLPLEEMVHRNRWTGR